MTGSSAAGSSTDVGRIVRDLTREMSPTRSPAVEPDSELSGDLGFDSLDLVELVVALEDTLGLPPLDVHVMGRLERVEDLERAAVKAAGTRARQERR